MSLSVKDRPLLPSGSVNSSPPPPPRLFRTTGARVTPQVEWVEVHTKSVLNRVQGMPFKWSINPYRGCAHDCLYCLSGDTAVLMADGTTRVIQDLRAGDVIYGTARHGQFRRYQKTHVLAHWSVKKAAYRITLQDGTRLVASGDHRFLSDRGWKYVVGTEHGQLRRPHLTTNNRLIGVG
ncbi:MAG: intein-containing Rv2578c family radical SAM protein, partial [Acidimicrobiia bacterium]